jgi:hypothetical protein
MASAISKDQAKALGEFFKMSPQLSYSYWEQTPESEARLFGRRARF